MKIVKDILLSCRTHLKISRRLAAAALCLSMAAAASAAITGNGTAGNPFVLHTAEDWNTFASNISAGTNADKCYKLADDWNNSESPVTVMAGTDANRFNGIFEGNGKTLTVNISTGSAQKEFTAPFRYVKNGAFRNLTVAGTITTSIKYATGFAGNTSEEVSFDNCISAVTINSSINGDGTHGGFIATTENASVVKFNNCLFSGSFLGSSTTSNSGFIGWAGDSSKLYFTNCLFAPASITMSTTSSATYFRNPKDRTVTNCYYKQAYNTVQGTSASDMTNETLLEKLGADWQIADEKVVPIQNNLTVSTAVVNGIKTRYDVVEGSTVSLDYTVVDLDGNTLVKGTDYTASFKSGDTEVTDITEEGTYTLTITGIGSYRGTKTCSILAKAKTLTGSGTESSPYILSTADDWAAFVTYVSEGADSSVHFKLSDDWDNSESPVTAAVGTTDTKPFTGTFDGNGKTLNINITATVNGYGVFRHIENATIKNLTVAGTIDGGSDKYKILGGLAGYARGQCLITDCTVSTTIKTGYIGDSSLGGFLGEVNSGSTAFVNSVFNGSFNASSAYYFGGFNGWINGSARASFTNCLFAPSGISMNTSSSYKTGSGTFSRGTNWTVTDCYYTDTSKFGNVQGSQVSQTVPSTGLYKTVTFLDTNYYAAGTPVISGIESRYMYTGNALTLDYTVTFNSTELTKNIDYTASITDSEGNETASLVEVGTYTIIVAGTGNYGGTYTQEIRILPLITGSGTEADPFIISNSGNWEMFAANINSGVNADKYYKLSDDFDNTDSPITTTAGLEGYEFKGVFDGNGKTLTLNINNSTLTGAAPFRYIAGGAVIKNLRTAGTVKGFTHTSGLVGFSIAEGTTADHPNTIENCTISATVRVEASSGNRHMGGVVGHGVTSHLKIKNTLFNGSMYSNANYAGCFMGWTDGGSLVLENCLFAGTWSGNAYFNPVAVKNSTATLSSVSATDVYYTVEPNSTSSSYNSYIAATGIKVSTTAPAEALYKTHTLFGTEYYENVSTEINGLASSYDATGSALEISYSVSYGGATLSNGTDYTSVIKNSENVEVEDVIQPGIYTLTVTGTGDFAGSKSTAITVVSPLTGNGTQESPYILSSVDDWNIFAQNIVSGVKLNSYYKLSDDWDNSKAPITAMVSTDNTDGKCFCGTFDGNGKTITIALSTTENYTGLFRYVKDAVFKNLTVAGTVTTSKQWAGGFASLTFGNTQFNNCTSSVEITGTADGDGTHGGFVAMNYENGNGVLSFNGCVFNGKLLGESCNANAGFVGYNYNKKTISYTNCLFAPAEVTMGENISATFNRNGNATFNNAFYTQAFGEAQGSLVTAATPENAIYNTLTCADGNDYYAAAVVSGVCKAYKYSDSLNVITETVKIGGIALARDTDYTVSVTTALGTSVDNLSTAGSYTVTFTGTGDCAGSVSCNFKVIDVDSALAYDNDNDTWYVNMPKTGTTTISNISRLSSFKVYDNGGKNSNYTDNCDGYLVITAPQGYTFTLTGTVVSESTNYDWLTVYDGDSKTASVLGSEKYASISGTTVNVSSTGSSLTLWFRTDSSETYSGLDLTVTINAPTSTIPYTVAFDANGGEGTMENMNFIGSERKNLTANAFTREGYSFLGWNTEQNGSGTSYSDGYEFWQALEEENVVITLYAQWGITVSANADPYTEDTYYTTFFDSTSNYTADCEVYYVASFGKTLTLVKAQDNIVKAGCGVILKASKDVITLIPTSEESSVTVSSYLTGTDVEKTFTAEQTAENDTYVLGLGENGVRFYLVSGSITIGAHKAYIRLEPIM